MHDIYTPKPKPGLKLRRLQSLTTSVNKEHTAELPWTTMVFSRFLRCNERRIVCKQIYKASRQLAQEHELTMPLTSYSGSKDEHGCHFDH